MSKLTPRRVHTTTSFTMAFLAIIRLSVLLICTVHSFTVKQPIIILSRATAVQSTTRLFLKSPHDKYFQLEEAEDVETCTTEVFLHADKTVFLGVSDGPLPSHALGRWNVEQDGTFTMTLSRTFDTGQPATGFTDMGEFSFTVVRELTGEITSVGESLAMTGSIHDKDEAFGDRQVGFFSMIDTTDAKLGKDNENDDLLPTIGRTQTSR